ncbi:MAG TPA: hypothetical protein VG965_06180 [Patescibacteria group bacterium]|nr:hypothetical protein [Patescibacteria group bacterium]
MNKTTTWILVVVAFLIGGLVGFLVERQRATDKMEAYKMEAQKMVEDAKMTAQPTPTAVPQESAVMMKKDAKLGEIAADSKNMTLYTYDKDTATKSNCTGQCATIWPPYLMTGAAPSPMPVHLSTIKRDDGSTQYAWDGKPLYYYEKDKDSGDAYGDGIGGIWHVAK